MFQGRCRCDDLRSQLLSWIFIRHCFQRVDELVGRILKELQPAQSLVDVDAEIADQSPIVRTW
jgi:hypothetical protein